MQAKQTNLRFGEVNTYAGYIFKFFEYLEDWVSLPLVGALQFHEKDGEIIRISFLVVGVVLEGLLGVDVGAVEDPEHQDL